MCTRQETDDAKVKDVLTESFQLPIIPSVLTTVTGLQAVAAEKISAELMFCFFFLLARGVHFQAIATNCL